MNEPLVYIIVISCIVYCIDVDSNKQNDVHVSHIINTSVPSGDRISCAIIYHMHSFFLVTLLLLMGNRKVRLLTHIQYN